MSRPKGFKHTEETKQKIREHHRGFNRPHTKEERDKISQSMKEWHRTHQHPKKGGVASPETRLKKKRRKTKRIAHQ